MAHYTPAERSEIARRAAQTRKENRQRREQETLAMVQQQDIVSQREKNRQRGLKARETYLRRRFSENEITQWGVDGNGIRMQQTTPEERSEAARRSAQTRKELVIRHVDRNSFTIGDVTIRRNRKGEWAVTMPVTFKGTFDSVLFQVVQALS